MVVESGIEEVGGGRGGEEVSVWGRIDAGNGRDDGITLCAARPPFYT